MAPRTLDDAPERTAPRSLDPVLIQLLREVESGTIKGERCIPLFVHCGVPASVAREMLDVKPIGPPPPAPAPVVQSHVHVPKDAMRVVIEAQAAPAPIVVPPSSVVMPPRQPFDIVVHRDADRQIVGARVTPVDS